MEQTRGPRLMISKTDTGVERVIRILSQYRQKRLPGV